MTKDTATKLAKYLRTQGIRVRVIAYKRLPPKATRPRQRRKFYSVRQVWKRRKSRTELSPLSYWLADFLTDDAGAPS